MATDQNGDLLINNEGAAALDEHEQKSSALGFLSNTDVLRQITLILGLTICLAIAVFILLWGKEPEMRPLGTFTTQELVSTLDYLDQQKIPYQVDGKSVLVSAENYADIRLRLTRAGLANNSDASNDGEAILLKDSSFGVSQRMESERLKLSRERQLASAIEQFQNVAKAQVLLAIPKDNVFARNERKPSATVVLSLKGNALGQGEVDSIVDMVASAVFSQPPVGSVGLSEADARHLHGKVDIYLSRFRPMKTTFYGGDERCMIKLVVEAGTEKILGCHVVGPDSPEIIQMAAIALKMGVTKPQWDSTCAVHPTLAEELVTMRDKYVPQGAAA